MGAQKTASPRWEEAVEVDWVLAQDLQLSLPQHSFFESQELHSDLLSQLEEPQHLPQLAQEAREREAAARARVRYLIMMIESMG